MKISSPRELKCCMTENIFKKRHLGLFAANLKAAIRGRRKPPLANSSQLYRSSLSSSRSFHTSPSEGYPPSIHSQVHQTSRQQQPLPSRFPYTTSSGDASYSNAVKNGHNTYNIPQSPQQQQNFPPQHYNVQSFSPSHLAQLSGSGTDSFCSSPKRLWCWKSPGSWNPKGTGIFNPIF